MANSKTNAELQEENDALRAELDKARSANEATVPTLTRIANEGGDPSNTYEHGANGNVNQAVPEGAEVITDFEAAYDAGYFGYARGAKSTGVYSAQEAGKRNTRLREARRATRNRSAAATEADGDGTEQGAQPSNG